MELLVALAIIALLAAMLYPTVGAQFRKGESTALANQLDNLRQSIANYRTNVQKFPSQLTQLTTQPVVGTDRDICGTLLPAANVALWRGPYLTQVIQATGVPTGDATIRNALGYVGGGLGQPGTLRILVDNVENSAANDLEAQFDGNANLTTGTILWTVVSGTLGTLTFQIPIRSC
jgi:type II secretory pathway pseudopilin PulG